MIPFLKRVSNLPSWTILIQLQRHSLSTIKRKKKAKGLKRVRVGVGVKAATKAAVSVNQASIINKIS
jgi:hypothetical protein